MATSKELTGETLFDLTLYVADTPANHLAKQASGKENKIQGTCGPGYDRPLANYDPDTQSWKMLEGISLWGDCPSLETLPASGMTQNGVLSLQPAWEQITDETESLSWPTPTAVTRAMEGNVRMYRAKIQAGEMTEQEAEAILGKSVWEAQGKIPAMWPTPRVTGSGEDIAKIQERFRNGLKYKQRLEEAVALWPTMTANGMGSTGHRQLLEKNVSLGHITPQEKRQMSAGNGGRLNPMWVEWLMGFPIGWTDLEGSETL
jgi:hypothetical protein